MACGSKSKITETLRAGVSSLVARHGQAQRLAADIANQVAYEILTTTQPVTGLICGRFITQYGLRLSPAIPGSRVRTCTPGLLVVPFP